MAKKTMFNIFFGVVLAGLLIGFVNIGIIFLYPIPEACEFERDICEPDKTCEPEEIDRTECDNARDARNQVIFYILASVGLVAMIIGFIATNLMLNWAGLLAGFVLIIEGMVRLGEVNLLNFITSGVLIGIAIFAFFRFNKKLD